MLLRRLISRTSFKQGRLPVSRRSFSVLFLCTDVGLIHRVRNSVHPSGQTGRECLLKFSEVRGTVIPPECNALHESSPAADKARESPRKGQDGPLEGKLDCVGFDRLDILQLPVSRRLPGYFRGAASTGGKRPIESELCRRVVPVG